MARGGEWMRLLGLGLALLFGACAPDERASEALKPEAAGETGVVEAPGAVNLAALTVAGEVVSRSTVEGLEAEPEEDRSEAPRRITVEVVFPYQRNAKQELDIELGWYSGGRDGVRALDSDFVLKDSLAPKEKKTLGFEVPVEASGLWVRTIEQGFAQIKKVKSLRAGESQGRITLAVKPGATARGVVLSDTGVMPWKVSMKIDPKYGKHLGGRLQRDGRIELHFKGKGFTRAMVDGYEKGSAIFDLPKLTEADAPQDMRFELALGEGFGGLLVDGAGRPLPGTQVLVLAEDLAPTYINSTKRYSGRAYGVTAEGRRGDLCRTDGEGHFRAVGLGPTPVVVLARRDGARRWKALHEGALPVATFDHRFQIQASRLSVRLRQPEGGYAIFDPTNRPKPSGGVGRVGRLGEGLRVSMRRVREARIQSADFFGDGVTEFTDFGDYKADQGPPKEVDELRWFPTEDPTRWEVHFRPKTNYVLQAISRDRSEASKNLDMLATQSLREVELVLSPARKPGQLELTVVDPEGTRGVTTYRLHIKSEQGSFSWDVSRFNLSSTGSHSAALWNLELPSGRYQFTLTPSSSSWRRRYSQDRVIPGPVKEWIDIVSGGKQVSTLHTKPVGKMTLSFGQSKAGCVVVLERTNPTRELRRREFKALEPFGLVWNDPWSMDLETGHYRLRTVLAGMAFSTQFEIKFGGTVTRTLDETGFAEPK